MRPYSFALVTVILLWTTGFAVANLFLLKGIIEHQQNFIKKELNQ